jgi:hypothetical protein
MNFRQLRVHRQNSLNVNAALCDKPQVLHVTDYSHEKNKRVVTNRAPVNGMVEFMTPAFLKQWHVGLPPLEKLPTIACLPTKTLFPLLGLSHVDIWILGEAEHNIVCARCLLGRGGGVVEVTIILTGGICRHRGCRGGCAGGNRFFSISGRVVRNCFLPLWLAFEPLLEQHFIILVVGGAVLRVCLGQSNYHGM